MKISIFLILSLIAFNNLNAASHVNTLYRENTMYQTREGSPSCVAICTGDLEMIKKSVEYSVNINKEPIDFPPII